MTAFRVPPPSVSRLGRKPARRGANYMAGVRPTGAAGAQSVCVFALAWDGWGAFQHLRRRSEGWPLPFIHIFDNPQHLTFAEEIVNIEK